VVFLLEGKKFHEIKEDESQEKVRHNVDSDKIISRYHNTLQNLLPVLKLSDRAYLFDNSNEMILIAELDEHELKIKVDSEQFPNWFTEYVINKI
jgi:predicted ABC-type ATPase